MTQIEYTHDYFLTAAQCNPQKELPVGLLVRQVIDVVIEHANIIGVGATSLGKLDATWVLSRLAFEVSRYPSMEERYSITTWVESFAKFLSERSFEIRDGEGEVIGRVRTTWVAINRHSRRPTDISELAAHVTCDPGRQCDIAPVPRLRPIAESQIENPYTFRMSDIDFNRHVNSVRYADLFINQIGLLTYDDFFISRFEIMFQHEAHFGDRVVVASSFGEEAMVSQICSPENVYCLNRIFMSRREDNRPVGAASVLGQTADF